MNRILLIVFLMSSACYALEADVVHLKCLTRDDVDLQAMIRKIGHGHLSVVQQSEEVDLVYDPISDEALKILFKRPDKGFRFRLACAQILGLSLGIVSVMYAPPARRKITALLLSMPWLVFYYELDNLKQAKVEEMALIKEKLSTLNQRRSPSTIRNSGK